MTSIPSEWHKDGFVISTSHALLQTDVINKAFDTDYMYWTKGMSEEGMKKMLSNSLCFGVYILPSETAGQLIRPPKTSNPTAAFQILTHPLGRSSLTQIGLGRLITDVSTFAYLTDVFILPEYRGSGLGKWLMECINETLDSWPDLRRAVLFTSGDHAKRFYRETLEMKVFEAGTNGLELMSKRGPGSVFKDN